MTYGDLFGLPWMLAVVAQIYHVLEPIALSHKKREHAYSNCLRRSYAPHHAFWVLRDHCLLARYGVCISVSQTLTGSPNVALRN